EDVRNWLVAYATVRVFLDERTHPAQDLYQPGPRRVDAHTGDPNPATWREEAEGQEISGRGEVSRHGHAQRLEELRWVQLHGCRFARPVLDDQIGAHRPEEAFGVVPGESGFADPHPDPGGQPSK